MAGVFFAFSTFVMAALARLPAPQGISAMQHINITVINPWFLGAFLGAGAACAAAIIAVLTDWRGSYGPLVLVGGALYLIGSIGLTFTYHQPRNLAIDRLDPDSTSSGAGWARYRAEWVAANHVRTIAPAIASGLPSERFMSTDTQAARAGGKAARRLDDTRGVAQQHEYAAPWRLSCLKMKRRQRAHGMT